MAKKTMTLNLSASEMEVLDALAEKKGLNKTAVLRQALRLYQTIDERLSQGDKLFLEDKNKEKAEFLLL